MKRTPRAPWGALAAFIGASALALTLPGPAVAQVVPPERNAIDLGVIPASGYTVYTAGFSRSLTPSLDLTAGYVDESASGNTASLLDAGFRYHLTPPASRGDIYLSGGFSSLNASASLSFGNFTASGSGYNVGAGASVQLTRSFVGYVSGSLLSLGGLGSVTFYEVGLQMRFAPYVWGRVGVLALSSGGSVGGAPYLGFNLSFP
jgi:hypothetical protein